MADINKEYAELGQKILQSNYQVYIHNRALSEYNIRMYDLNQEADRRTHLDKQAAIEAKQKEEQNVE